MGQDKVEGYAEGYIVGWNDCKKRWIDKFSEFACCKDDQWFKDWLKEDDSEFINFANSLNKTESKTDQGITVQGGLSGGSLDSDKEDKPSTTHTINKVNSGRGE